MVGRYIVRHPQLLKSILPGDGRLHERALEEPVVTIPVTAEEPVKIEEPLATEGLATVADPAAIEEPLTIVDPPETEEPEKIEEPIVIEEPAASAETATTEDVVVFEEMPVIQPIMVSEEAPVTTDSAVADETPVDEQTVTDPTLAPTPAVVAHDDSVAPLPDAYCVKCRTKRGMQNAKKIVTKNGRNAMEGTCPVCGTRLFRFMSIK
ncbi:DUF5679 domain-containing protein [Dictyobacter kobayashii]|nr:DUF5679 domain-containing protein [Dictyobacter kobayashii]